MEIRDVAPLTLEHDGGPTMLASDPEGIVIDVSGKQVRLSNDDAEKVRGWLNDRIGEQGMPPGMTAGPIDEGGNDVKGDDSAQTAERSDEEEKTDDNPEQPE